MTFDLTTIKPILESKTYALYTMGQVAENLWKGVRVDKRTQEQVEVYVSKSPIRVVEKPHTR